MVVTPLLREEKRKVQATLVKERVLRQGKNLS